MANTYKVELPTSSDCSVIAPWPTNQTQITCLCLESKTLALSLLRALHLISCQARIRFTSWAAVLPKAAARALLRHWVFPQERLFTPLQQPLGCQPSSPACSNAQESWSASSSGSHWLKARDHRSRRQSLKKLSSLSLSKEAVLTVLI